MHQDYEGQKGRARSGPLLYRRVDSSKDTNQNVGRSRFSRGKLVLTAFILREKAIQFQILIRTCTSTA